MKIAYFDLHKNDIHEDYSIRPQRYGGAATFARYAKQVLNENNNEFKIFAMEESFSSYTDLDNKNFYKLSKNNINQLNNFQPVINLFPELKDFDIFMFHHDGFTINKNGLKAKNVYWPLVSNSSCHPNNDLLLLYSKDLICFYSPSNTKVDLFKIGVSTDKVFKEREKEPFVFQCTQHVDTFGSIEVAKECLAHRYKCFFAGPIFNSYNLLDFIDNQTTFYLGQISQDEKVKLYEKATFSTFFHKHQTPFNLSLIESLNYGVIPICIKNTFFNNLIQDGQNGYFYNDNFNQIINKTDLKKLQKNCFNTAQLFSKEEMIHSFIRAINNNLNIY